LQRFAFPAVADGQNEWSRRDLSWPELFYGCRPAILTWINSREARAQAARVARRFCHPAKPLFLHMNCQAIGPKRRAGRPQTITAPGARGLLVR
jgi:hypothetical protein